MADYLIIESRDPFESNDVRGSYELATNLAKEGNAVTLFLVQNGVLPARRSPASAALSQLAQDGVKVLADAFSLQERGIAVARLAEGVKAAEIDLVVEQLAAGSKAFFH